MRYKLTLEYDGTNLLGWQRQQDGPSAQEYLETAISLFMGIPPLSREEYAEMKNSSKTDEIYDEASTFECSQASGTEAKKTGFNEENESGSTERNPTAYIRVREEVSTGRRSQASVKPRFYPVQCAGRTDAAVHALAQVAHFDVEKDIDTFRLKEGLNAHLRNNNMPMCVLEAEKVADDFNARFSAISRGYIYRILNRRSFPVLDNNRVWWVPYQLDVEKMREGAEYLLGHHDFSSFRASACQAKSPLRTLDKLEIIEVGDEIRFIVEARSFLHHQVRNMVGTLKQVGAGVIQPEEIKTILEAKDRKAAGPTAPACGLYLSKVVY